MAVELTLRNEIQVRREGEWLCRGTPFPQGTLRDAGALRLRDEQGNETPLAVETLARWPDDSVKWALLQFPVYFEGYGRKAYSLDWGDAPGRRAGGLRSVQMHFVGTIWTTSAFNEGGFCLGMTGLSGRAVNEGGIPTLFLLHLQGDPSGKNA